jgi:hypothetical protein
MQSNQRQRQQEAAWGKRFLLILILISLMIGKRSQAEEPPPARVCRFAVALPEMEGSVTLGIFSAQGNLVRLLYQDASVESIPAGLNGLIMSWNEKDEAGVDVPAGTYRARGIVHGPLSLSRLPWNERRERMPFSNALQDFSMDSLRNPFLRNRITVMAAQDALQEKRSLLVITAQRQKNIIVVEAEGLPLCFLPLERDASPMEIVLHHALGAGSAGMAVLTLIGPSGSESTMISGLDQIVPLDAGSLEIPESLHAPLNIPGEGVPPS